MKSTMTELYRGCMRGRTMYVIPFCMGPLDAEHPMLGVEITDSEYVVALDEDHDAHGRRRAAAASTAAATTSCTCLHSVGAPLDAGPGRRRRGRATRPSTSSHFPETREIWSYGSGYGGNALLGKKCYALRIASAMAHDEGWLAEHMLILKLISPGGEGVLRRRRVPVAPAARPTSRCCSPPSPAGAPRPSATTSPGCASARTAASTRSTPSSASSASRPAPTGRPTPTPCARWQQGNSIFTNVALTDDGDVWWEGMEGEPAAPDVVDRARTGRPDSDEPAAHPNSRYTMPIGAVPRSSRPSGTTRRACRSRRSCSAAGARPRSRWSPRPATGSTARSWAPPCRARRPRRPRAGSARCAATRWRCCRSSATTWATTSSTGCDVGKCADADKLPKIFYVNWFRRGDDGRFLWPGFGENSRVLKWCIERIEGRAAAVETPVGHVPDARPDRPRRPRRRRSTTSPPRCAVDVDEWREEIPLIEEWFDKIGDKLPTSMRDELEALKLRLGM